MIPLIGVSNDGPSGGGPTPVITVDQTLLAFGNIGQGQTSAAQSYHVSGINLVDNITVTAPTGYIINLDGSTTNASPIVLIPALGVVASTQIFIRFKPTSLGTFNTNVSNSSAGAITKDVAVTGTAPNQTISVVPSSLTYADTRKDDYSTAQTYSVSGQYLIGNIVITVPSGFIINQDGSTTDTSPITLVQVSGSVVPTTIYVRFHPLLVQPYSDNVTHTTTSGTTVNVAVSGVGVTPAIFSSVASISGISYQQPFGPSSASSPAFSFSGIELFPAAGNLTVTPSSNIEIYDGTTWQSSAFTVAYVGGNLFTSAIYQVRLKAGLSSSSYPSESVTISGGGAISLVITVSGTVTARPLISVTDNSLSFPDTDAVNYSSAQNYDVSGANLVADIVIAGVDGFVVNLDGSNVDATPITLPKVGTVVSATTIYVKFHPTEAGAYAGAITHTSSGAIQNDVSVNGLGTQSVFERFASYYHNK